MKDELATLFGYDERKFRETINKDGINDATQDQLISYMIMWGHSLEKSLSRDNFEPGHSLNVVQYLANTLKVYSDKGYDKSVLGYKNTMSVLYEFHKAQMSTEYAKSIEDILGDFFSEVKPYVKGIGGSEFINPNDKKYNSQKNFEELSSGRYSVRSFSDKEVHKADIEKAVAIATKTPTVCNRQPIRVRLISNKKHIEEVLNIQQGVSGYPTPPSLLLVTADDTCYLGSNERNQGFVDGGLFAMSLLYALEHIGLGACPLNCMFDEDREKAMRGLLDIPNSEKLIMFISCGHFKDSIKVCKSFRYPVEHILSEVNQTYSYVVKKEPISEVEAKLNMQEVELSLLRRPGVKLATRKLLGSIRRRIKSSFVGAKVGIKNLKEVNRQDQVSAAGKDGATVTICVYNNFGNILQRFALVKFLNNNGLNFDSFDMLDKDSVEVGPVNQNFIEFADKYISSVSFDKKHKNAYRNYIVGSDQVWRPKHLQSQIGGIGSFLLDFVKDDKRGVNKIAYGASFGFATVDDNEYKDIISRRNTSLLGKFSAISVREKSAKKIVNNLYGREVEPKVVIDPTMLLDRGEYNKIIDASSHEIISSPEVFYFVFDNTPRYETVTNEINKNFQNIVYDWPDNVEGWLRYIRDSKLIVAGSFHAVVFSIIFNTDFVLMESSDEPNERVRNLLTSLNIDQDRIVNDTNYSEFSLNGLQPIDWSKVNTTVGELARDSGDWLLNNIKK